MRRRIYRYTLAIAFLGAVTAALGAAVNAPEAPAEKPPLPSAHAALPPPALPQFALGPRILVTPAPALAPRIPNLLVTPRKYAQASANPGTSPAVAIVTAPVNNVEGTAALPMLAPFTRDIVVDIAPPAAPLAFDREPYLQSPDAPDDLDAPAAISGAPAKVRLD
ncbi:MAG: hypothetical protein JWN40_5609 [Phycisphaerales bacterium]|nr:hypothetical protein [Phycisphaerales bacterium]